MVDFSPGESPELNRLKRKLGIECLWVHILSLLEKEPLYAYELQEMLEKELGISASRIISYRVLYPLESRGLVSSFTREVDGRERRYYEITDKGRKAVAEAKVFLDSVRKFRA